MNILEIIILAIIQGLTEYLPISSTAHLLIAQRLLNIQPNILFTIVLQLGTIFASIIYFRKKILSIAKTSISNVKAKKYKSDLGIWILIGIIPVLVAGFFVSDILDQIYSQPYIIVFTTITFGIIFYLIELYNKKAISSIDSKELSLKNIFVIGVAQIFSLIPGVSRSGATISGGLIQRISFKDSIEISFLMSIPIMLIAGFYELIKNIKLFTPELAIQLLVGIVVAYLAGIVSIKITLGFLGRYGFLPFLAYRILFGIFILFILV